MWTLLILPYVATGLALLGNWLLAKKNIAGWWTHIVATSCWIIYGLLGAGGLHLALACLIYVPFEIYGIMQWRRNED